MMEALIRFIVSNRSFTLLLLLTITVVAWIKLPEIKVSQYPAVQFPVLMIEVVLPGASASEIEQRVIAPIEDKLQNTRNLYEFKTRILNSYASIFIQYDYGVDIDDEHSDINDRINNIKSDMPAGTEITVLKQNPVDLIVSFVIGVSSEIASLDTLKETSDALAQRLRQLPTIEEVEEIFPEEEILIDLDLARIESARLDVQQIERTLKANNQYLPTGTFNVGDKALSVLAFGNGYTSLEEIRETMLINREGKALTLRDVANVRRVNKPDTRIASVNGAEAVLITMKLQEDANIFAARREMQQLLDDFEAPAGVDISLLFDSEAGVNYKLSGLVTNILQGVGILAVVLLFSVGIRSALIIVSTLPAALFLSIVGLSFTDYGIQEVSLAGFIIALGLIVDNGIVVTENAYKLNHYNGHSHNEAAILGTSSVVSPLLSSTATTALAFAPLYLLTSPSGLFLHSLVAVIWLCLGASLVAAIVISSILISRFGTENHIPYLPSPPSFLIALIPFRDGPYRKALGFFIRHPLVLAALVAGLMAVTAMVASRLPVIVFPDSEEPFFTVNVKAPPDRGSAYTRELAESVRRVVEAHDSVQDCSTMLGMSFPKVNTGSAEIPRRRNNAQVFCGVDFRDAGQLNELLDRLNSDLAQFSAEAEVRAEPFAVGSRGDLSDVEVKLNGPRIAQVRETMGELETYLRQAGIPGIASLENDAESRYFALDLTFQERRASALGIDRASVDRVLALITHGREIDSFRDGSGDEFPIVLRAEAESEDPLNVFDRLFLTSTTGAKVPLSQVIEVSFREDEYDINHELFKPSVSLRITAEKDYPIRKLTSDVEAAVSGFELPAGYSVMYDGKVADQVENFGGISKYLGIIGLIVLAIFVFQFGSLLQPLIICAAIPLSFIGAFLLLYPTDQPISFLAFIGLTSLMGIVINNSILLVDEGNQIRELEPELPIAEVAIKSGLNRFMPILLTSITSIVGLLPLAMGTTMFNALAIVIIGGLTTSTFLTLLCLPVLFALVTRRSTKVSRVTHDWVGRSRLGEE